MHADRTCRPEQHAVGACCLHLLALVRAGQHAHHQDLLSLPDACFFLIIVPDDFCDNTSLEGHSFIIVEWCFLNSTIYHVDK